MSAIPLYHPCLRYLAFGFCAVLSCASLACTRERFGGGSDAGEVLGTDSGAVQSQDDESSREPGAASSSSAVPLEMPAMETGANGQAAPPDSNPPTDAQAASDQSTQDQSTQDQTADAGSRQQPELDSSDASDAGTGQGTAESQPDLTPTQDAGQAQSGSAIEAPPQQTLDAGLPAPVPSASVDGGTELLDAATLEPIDDPVDDAGPEAEPEAGTSSEPSCSGSVYEGICWYLGALGDSCNEACVEHGGVDPSMSAVVGTQAQGGSAEQCAQLLELLGRTGNLQSGSRTDGRGMGCHLFGTPARAWWLTSPTFDPSSSLASGRVVCGCME